MFSKKSGSFCLIILLLLTLIAGCGGTPEEKAYDAAKKEFDAKNFTKVVEMTKPYEITDKKSWGKDGAKNDLAAMYFYSSAKVKEKKDIFEAITELGKVPLDIYKGSMYEFIRQYDEDMQQRKTAGMKVLQQTGKIMDKYQ